MTNSSTTSDQAMDAEKTDDPNSEESSLFSSGDPVVDTEDSDPSPGIVIHTPDSRIEEWTLTIDGEETTVAETNREYDPEEPVVLISFEWILDEYWPEWTEADVRELFDGVCENSVKFYSFPESRLSSDPSRRSLEDRQGEAGANDVDSQTNSEEDAEDSRSDGEASSEDVQTDVKQTPAQNEEEENEEIEDEWEPPEWLEAFRELTADSTTTKFDTGREALQVEKLGEAYYIRGDGSIEGEGLLKSQLESLVEDARTE